MKPPSFHKAFIYPLEFQALPTFFAAVSANLAAYWDGMRTAVRQLKSAYPATRLNPRGGKAEGKNSTAIRTQEVIENKEAPSKVVSRP
jgi:hypothetical protein